MTAAASIWPAHVNGRTGQKVRRDSQPHDAAKGWFRPLKKVTVTQIQRGAERLALRSMRARAKGKRAGELTLQDLNILEALLFRFMTWSTGECDPTYQQIQDVTGHARDTIATAIRRLCKLGILERMRRFNLVPDADGKGPQVHQAPNAYRFALPERLRVLLGLGGSDVPAPDDAVTAARDGRLLNQSQQYAIEQQEAERTGKPNVASALARLESGVAQRESRK